VDLNLEITIGRTDLNSQGFICGDETVYGVVGEMIHVEYRRAEGEKLEKTWGGE